MADWKKLIAYLDEQDENRVQLTVTEISEIVGDLKVDGSAWFDPTQEGLGDYWRYAYVLPILEEAGWTIDFTDYVKQVVGFCLREKEDSESMGDMKLYVPASAGECVVVNRGTAVEPMFHIGRILTFVGEGTPNRKAIVHFEGKTEDTPYSAFTESALGIVAFCRLATSRTPLPKGPLDYSLADLAAPEEWVADEAIDKWIPKKFKKKVREAKSHLRPFDIGKTADELDEELFGGETETGKNSDLNPNAEVDGDEDFDDVLDETVESILANDEWTKDLILDSVIEEMGLLSDNGRPITRRMNWYKALARRRKKGIVEQLAAEYPQALVNWWWDGDEDEQTTTTPASSRQAVSAPIKMSAKERGELLASTSAMKAADKVRREMENAYMSAKTFREMWKPAERKAMIDMAGDMLERIGERIEELAGLHQQAFDGKVPAEFKELLGALDPLMEKELDYAGRRDFKTISFWEKDGRTGVDFHYGMWMRWTGTDEGKWEQAVATVTYRSDDERGPWRGKIGVYITESQVVPEQFDPFSQSTNADPGDVVEEIKAQLGGWGLGTRRRQHVEVDASVFQKLEGWKEMTTKAHMPEHDVLRVLLRPSHATKDTAQRVMQDVFAATRSVYPAYSVSAVPRSDKEILFQFDVLRDKRFLKMDEAIGLLSKMYDLSREEIRALRKTMIDTRFLTPREPADAPKKRRRKTPRSIEPTQVDAPRKAETKTEPSRPRKPRSRREGARMSLEDVLKSIRDIEI